MPRPLNTFSYSLEHQPLRESLLAKDRLLLIQDLDGVCMGLVRDPKRRSMDPEYVRACKQLERQFYVLTNGEHVGSRGVNVIVDTAFSEQPAGWAEEQGLYLPGLAAGGVQFQDCFGAISHPGVSERELAFLESAPQIMLERLRTQLSQAPFDLPAATVERLLGIIVLDNAVSPTVNIGSLHDAFADSPALYPRAQTLAASLMDELLARAEQEGLAESFFVHLAPNLGSKGGVERIKPATGDDMGTTDFQLMVRGAIKEVGVMVLLNHYFFIETGKHPLGAEFNARTAPHDREALLALAEQSFDPALMPSIVAVGDTVTSSPRPDAEGHMRGGSDRGFLTLTQELGRRFGTDNAVVFVDSSGGELNRPGVHPAPRADEKQVPLSALESITDADDPLKLNVIFAGGHQEYVAFFIALARAWHGRDQRAKA